jgi:hypothetical protein
MHRHLTFPVAVVLGTTLVVGVENAAAQTGAIAGVVKDASGAVLPGVTVEASSPALIEKTRTAVTDGQGLYKIIELRPPTAQSDEDAPPRWTTVSSAAPRVGEPS